MLLQLTGLSGAGKTTLAVAVKALLEEHNLRTEIIDGDVYRKTLCKDLGFSKEDRIENIRRLGIIAQQSFSGNNVVIISAINPFEISRANLKERYQAKTIWVKCNVDVLLQRDTKGLYKKAMLPHGHPDKISNLTGINDTYEIPVDPDLMIDTSAEPASESAGKLLQFIMKGLIV